MIALVLKIGSNFNGHEYCLHDFAYSSLPSHFCVYIMGSREIPSDGQCFFKCLLTVSFPDGDGGVLQRIYL